MVEPNKTRTLDLTEADQNFKRRVRFLSLLMTRWPQGACSGEMQVRIPNADYTSAVAEGANDKPKRSDFAGYTYGTFAQMLDSGSRRDNLNSYHVVDRNLSPYDLDAGNQNFCGTVDVVVAGDLVGLWSDCTKTCTAVDAVVGRCCRAPRSPLPWWGDWRGGGGSIHHCQFVHQQCDGFG
jgi:hypothetical protein